MGYQVPALGGKGGNYVFHHLVGNVLYLSGNTGRIDGKLKYTGLLGKDLTVEQGYEMARCCALNHLAMIQAAMGDLDRIEQLIRMTGWVASAPSFVDQPKVVNGASDLFVELLGRRGEHCRSRFARLDAWVRMRLRSFLWQRKARGRAHQLWPNAFWARLGLFSLTAHVRSADPLRWGAAV